MNPASYSPWGNLGATADASTLPRNSSDLANTPVVSDPVETQGYETLSLSAPGTTGGQHTIPLAYVNNTNAFVNGTLNPGRYLCTCVLTITLASTTTSGQFAFLIDGLTTTLDAITASGSAMWSTQSRLTRNRSALGVFVWPAGYTGSQTYTLTFVADTTTPTLVNSRMVTPTLYSLNYYGQSATAITVPAIISVNFRPIN